MESCRVRIQRVANVLEFETLWRLKRRRHSEAIFIVVIWNIMWCEKRCLLGMISGVGSGDRSFKNFKNILLERKNPILWSSRQKDTDSAVFEKIRGEIINTNSRNQLLRCLRVLYVLSIVFLTHCLIWAGAPFNLKKQYIGSSPYLVLTVLIYTRIVLYLYSYPEIEIQMS